MSNSGKETLGSFFWAQVPKNPKNGQYFEFSLFHYFHYKSLFHYFLLNIIQIDLEDSENRGPETLGSIIRATALKAP